MLLSKSTRTVTDFDERAVRRQAADLRARFLRSYALGAWNALRRIFSGHAPRSPFRAGDVQGSRRQWFTEASGGSWTMTP